MLEIQELIFLWEPDQSPVVSSLRVMIWHFGTVVSYAVSSRARAPSLPLKFPHSIKLHFLWSDHIPLAPALNFPHHTQVRLPVYFWRRREGQGGPSIVGASSG